MLDDKYRVIRAVVLVAVLVPLPTTQAELQLGSLFTDHMVLQRSMPVPIWGTADPSAKIRVAFGDQTTSAVADEDGKWMVSLDSISASSEPRVLSVTSNHDSIVQTKKCTDVLVGEVWICSGQSNMQFGVGGVPEVKALIPRLGDVRTFDVKRTVAFTEQDTCEGEWVDRYPDSAVALGFAHSLQQNSDVPIGIILSCWGSSSLEAWMPRDMIETVPHFKTMMQEFDANAEAREQINATLTGPQPWSRKEDIFLRRQSNILYNAMMHPLAPYACRGLVWYQGERNTQSMHGMLKEPWYSRNSGMLRYGDVLKQWIQRYRQEWNRDDMHFLVVMLPGYGAISKTSPDVAKDNPAAHSWAWMRESQLQSLELAHTGVANTIDLGDAKNIHPKDKLPVGQRLALLATRDTLGQPVEAEGPMMRNIQVNGDSVVVHFDHAGGMRTVDGAAPSGFWLADDSAKWVPADAEIDGDTVVLRAPDLTKPRHVRYAFVGKPDVNLVNAAGLPAYPFRTDTFSP